MNGVKSARRCLHACACFVFFACARLSKTAVTGRLAYDWASALQTRKSNNASVCGCQTPRTARSHTRPHWSRSPLAVLASRTTGSDVTCEKAIDASWPVTSRIPLWRSITLPPLGQFSPWSTENSAPQPSQTDGICTRGLWYRIATPSLNSLGDKAALFLMLGVTDSQAPIGWSAALRTARCLDSENDEMTSLRPAALPALRTIRCSLLAARTACRCVLRFTSTRPEALNLAIHSFSRRLRTTVGAFAGVLPFLRCALLY